MDYSSRTLLKLLKDAGFVKVSQKGSHVKMKKGSMAVVVPHPKKDIPKGTYMAILRQAGLK